MENTFIYLIGFPGVGKYTVAQTIAKQADVIVLDNQLINMPIFALFKPDGKTPLPPQMWDKVKAVWNVVFDAIVELADPAFNFVLTNVLLDDDEADHEWFRKVATMASEREGKLLPVRLLCDLAENKRRVTSPDRAQRLKMVDPDALDRLHRDRKVLVPAHPDTMTLDVTELSPDDAAVRIVKAASRLP